MIITTTTTTTTIIILCRYMKRPVMSCPGLYDPTNIMDANTLSRLITLCEDSIVMRVFILTLPSFQMPEGGLGKAGLLSDLLLLLSLWVKVVIVSSS